jgi:hypothetical protein
MMTKQLICEAVLAAAAVVGMVAPTAAADPTPVSSTLRSGSKHLASQSTDRGASCSYAAMGARENFESGSRVESAHRGY